jgi:nitrogen fixation/metabolism regulation signal transduction histidine kinase
VTACFVVANLVVLVLMFTVFHFLHSLNKEIDQIMEKSNQVTLLTDEIRISAVSILKYQRRIIANKADPEVIERIIDLCNGFLSQLQTLDTLYKESEVKKIIATMSGYVNSLKIVLSKATFYRDNAGLDSISDLSDKILEAFSEFQYIQYNKISEGDGKVSEIINETKKNMMITLIIGFLGTIILGLIVPGKIALPFKKINDAIRELQDCNFDVSIYYNQDDEIGEIANEMNKMIANMKKFEELRSDRINVELRKFDALANLAKRPVLVGNSEGKVIYLNTPLYEILQVQSDDIINKNMAEAHLPDSMVAAYELAIKRRSKIENAEILIPRKKNQDEENGENGENEEEEIAFQGHAVVIPIRGKDSSLDYYLMVMSTQVFV